MSLFDLFKGTKQDPAAAEAAQRRQTDILASVLAGRVPAGTTERLQSAAYGTKPWMATLTPAELMIVRSHGMWSEGTVRMRSRSAVVKPSSSSGVTRDCGWMASSGQPI